MNILITGATGFIGQAIVQELFLNKPENRKIYSLGNSCIDKNPEISDYYQVDITNLGSFSSLETLEEIDVVIHCAGLAHQFRSADQEKFFSVNVEGTKNVLQFSAKKSLKHFILISSVSVYGSPGKKGKKKNFRGIDEQEICLPKGVYAISKLKAEEAVIQFCRENKVALTVLRLATVIGEGDRGNLARLIKAIDQKRFLMIGRGENFKTLVYKKDVAKACRLVLEKRNVTNKEAEILNVAAEPIQMKEIIRIIYKVLEKKQPRFNLPVGFIKVLIKIMTKLPTGKKIRTFFDTLNKWDSNEIFSGEKIKRKYSFEPEVTISEAIKREVNYYKKT